MNFKSGRGGTRKGAGRPAGRRNAKQVKPEFRRNRFCTRIPNYLADAVRQYGKPGPGRIVEKALIMFFSDMGNQARYPEIAEFVSEKINEQKQGIKE